MLRASSFIAGGLAVSSGLSLGGGGIASIQRPGDAFLSAQVEETLRRSRELVASRTSSVKWQYEQHGDGPLFNHGTEDIPGFARLILIGDEGLRRSTDPKDTLVMPDSSIFRQYVETLENRDAILEGGVLIPGPRPFFSSPTGSAYRTLLGAFLTLPHFSPTDVGVPDHSFWIDLMLYPGTGLLSLSEREGLYYMAPGIPRPHGEKAQAYRLWVEKGRPVLDEIRKKVEQSFNEWLENDGNAERRYQWHVWNKIGQYEEELFEIDAKGGLPLPSRIPIRVVDFGEVNL